MRRSAYFGVALIGLLVVAAISMAAGSGRKPAKEPQGSVSLRRISASEVMGILSQFPEMLPGYFADQKNDTGFLKTLFPFSEVTSASLEGAFPGVRFYKGLDGKKPPRPYLMAVAGSKRYMMPINFNRLLVDNGQKVTDENIVELAKAFVLLAVGSEPISNPETGDLGGLDSLPPIAFLEAKRIKVVNEATFKMKVRIGEQIEKWHFEIWRNQFGEVFRGNDKGLLKEYLLGVNQLPEHGRLDVVPRIDIDTAPRSAYVEYDAAQNPHYYATVDTNGHSTNDTVTFHLSGFPSESANVFVRVKDSIRGVVRLLQKVQMNSGSGSYSWPAPTASTGIFVAGAGYAYDTLHPDTSYHRATDTLRELTLEKVIDTTFPGSSELLKVYYCDQFFRTQINPQGEGHADGFAQCVEDDMLESWRMQVDTWSLGSPPDTDSIHQVFVNDSTIWYHMLAATGMLKGDDRKIAVWSNIDSVLHEYTDEEAVLGSTICHEFYHGIQWGLTDSSKWKSPAWWWFIDGQARFLQSVQCDTEEFLSSSRTYPEDANKYLDSSLNTSVLLQGYKYCLFWRFMYEHFYKDPVPQPQTALQFVRDCCAKTKGLGDLNPVSQGKLAIDAAISTYVPGYVPPPGWSNFVQILDQFAVACYLNDDTSFHCWNPNPPGVYSRPDFTLGTDTAFRLGPDETDAIGFTDSIPHSFGIDLMEVALDGRVPVPESEIGVHHKGTKTQRGYEAQMVLSAWRSWRLGGSISDPGPADGLDKQSAGSRLATPAERA